jgi:hypothetical protein
VSVTYLVTVTEDDVGFCFTDEEFQARTNTFVDNLIENNMEHYIPNDIEIEFKEGDE